MHGTCSEPHSARQCPLSKLRMGEKRLVACMRSNSSVFRHLLAMGIFPGTEIAIVSNNDASFIVGVRGGRITLSREIADEIMVV